MALQTATGAPSLSPQVISSYFVAQFYETISSKPKEVYKFYKESSSLSRPESIEAMAPVTTIQGHREVITDLVMSLDYYKDCVTEIISIDSQLSQDEGVFILVSAYLILQDKIQLKFSQAFFLASEGNGKYFVLNDMLRFVDDVQPEEHDQLSNGSTNDVSETPHIPDLDLSEVASVQDQQSDTEIHPLEGVLENRVEIQCTSQKGDAVGEKEPSVGSASVEPKVTQPVSKVTPSSEQEIVPKKSYASIVKVQGNPSAVPPKGSTSKARSASSVTAKSVSAVAGPATMPSSKARLTSSGPAKPVNGPQKSLAASPKATSATKVSVTGSGVSEKENSHDGEDYSVYVRNLPWNVTSDRVEMEFKKFGPIKPRGVQVRRNQFEHYCYAFVEFESIKSMQNALEASPVIVEGHEANVEEKRTKTRVRNGTIINGSFGGWRDNYPPGNGGRNDNFRGNGGFNGNFGYERPDFRNQGGYSGPVRVQGFQQRPFQDGDGRMGQQRSFGDGRMGQQRPFGDGRAGPQRPFLNRDGRVGQQRPFLNSGDGLVGQQRPFQNSGDGRVGQQRPFQNSGDGQAGQQRPFLNSGDGQAGQQRPFLNSGDGRVGQQRPFQNSGDGQAGQQRPFQSGDGRVGQQRPVQSGDGRMARSGRANQGNRSKQ